jgi:hypothetical protein
MLNDYVNISSGEAIYPTTLMKERWEKVGT